MTPAIFAGGFSAEFRIQNEKLSLLDNQTSNIQTTSNLQTTNLKRRRLRLHLAYSFKSLYTISSSIPVYEQNS